MEEELKHYKERCERDEKQINYLQNEIIRLTETINNLKMQLEFQIERTKKGHIEVEKKKQENTSEDDFSEINMKIIQLRSLIENLPTKNKSSNKNPIHRLRGGNEKDDFKQMLTSVGTVFGEDSNNLLANKEQVLQKWALNFEDLDFKDEKGAGAFSTVYDGYYKTQYVAIKKLRFESLPNYEEYLTTFEKEVALLSTLDHENVCKFVGVVTFPSYYMVSEFMENGSLDDLLHNKSFNISWTQQLNFLKDIARGMQYIHSLNPRIIHRDLKCGNVLVDKKLVCKLTDFGLSIPKSDRVNPNDLQQKWGIILDKNQNIPSYIQPVKNPVGTFPFIAPEIIDGKPYNELVDVYSYSMCIFHVITRMPPWSGKTDSVWGRLEKEALDNKKTLFKPDIPRYFPSSVKKLTTDCWENDPTLRPNFTVILKRLDEIETEPEPKIPN